MIDLHIHTTSSDGSDEPAEILRKAEQAGLKYISITDHDSIGAYQKLAVMNIGDYFSGRLIPGCEFSAVHQGQTVEILGYGIDLATINSTGIISNEAFLERENQYLKELMTICKNLGLKYNKQLSIEGKYFATQIIHEELKKYPENEKKLPADLWESINAFYRKYVSNSASPFFLDKTAAYPNIQEIASIIKAAGGKTFLAHLYGYYVDDHQQFLDSIVSLNALDGIECYHSLHSMDRTRFLLAYCREQNLYSSGGSDYHGKIKPGVILGETINGVQIPEQILRPWLTGLNIQN